MQSERKEKRYFVNKGNYDGMRKHLEEVDWSSRLLSISVDDMWEVINKEILSATELYMSLAEYSVQASLIRKDPCG